MYSVVSNLVNFDSFFVESYTYKVVAFNFISALSVVITSAYIVRQNILILFASCCVNSMSRYNFNSILPSRLDVCMVCTMRIVAIT